MLMGPMLVATMDGRGMQECVARMRAEMEAGEMVNVVMDEKFLFGCLIWPAGTSGSIGNGSGH